MNKLGIIYFSGTGNTKFVSKTLYDNLKSDFNVSINSIEKKACNEINTIVEESDLLIFLYPIYGSDMPENMREIIQNLPKVNNKKIAVVCTQYFFSGDGASILFEKIKEKGYIQKWAYQVNMPNNLCLKGSPFKQVSDYDKLKKNLNRATKKIEKIALSIIADKQKIEDHSGYHKWLGMLQRPGFQNKFRTYYQNGLIVDQEKCIQCNKCVNSCPNDVIKKNGNRIEHIDRTNCLVCFRCINFCPVQAISYKGFIKEPLYKGPTKDIFKELVN